MVTTLDVSVDDGRTVHAYDTGDIEYPAHSNRLAVIWHHGTPNIGTPPEPLFAAADRLGIRWVSYDRPGYGGSTSHLDRDVASAAADAVAVADALGIERFAVMGHSGGPGHCERQCGSGTGGDDELAHCSLSVVGCATSLVMRCCAALSLRRGPPLFTV